MGVAQDFRGDVLSGKMQAELNHGPPPNGLCIGGVNEAESQPRSYNRNMANPS